jgi:hypothetical protein
MRIDKTIRWVLLGSCLAALLLFSGNLAAQCQMCRTALTQSPEGLRWSRGINAGIMLLLAAPFLIAGSVALVIYQRPIARALARLRARWASSRLGYWKTRVASQSVSND